MKAAIVWLAVLGLGTCSPLSVDQQVDVFLGWVRQKVLERVLPSDLPLPLFTVEDLVNVNCSSFGFFGGIRRQSDAQLVNTATGYTLELSIGLGSLFSTCDFESIFLYKGAPFSRFNTLENSMRVKLECKRSGSSYTTDLQLINVERLTVTLRGPIRKNYPHEVVHLPDSLNDSIVRFLNKYLNGEGFDKVRKPVQESNFCANDEFPRPA